LLSAPEMAVILYAEGALVKRKCVFDSLMLVLFHISP
jgi:hypothetical protein